MNQSICILGRQPALGLAELESRFGPFIMPLGQQAALVDKKPSDIPLGQLGGTVKVGKVLAELPYTPWSKLAKYIADTLPAHLPYIPEGKIRFGLSVYGVNTNVREVNKTGLVIKKIIRNYGRSVRVVPNRDLQLSSAQSIHNQLTGHTGMELILIAHNDKVVLAQLTAVQNISAYAARDQARPKRDARVGMLPPKLAQIIINLGTGLPIDLKDNKTLLDPFCGTGVILQEAMLMDFDVYGTDLEPRMAEYAQLNIDWLRQRYPQLSRLMSLKVADATVHKWPTNIATLASEVYLGRPFSAEPKPEVLQEVMQDVGTILRKFLKNVAHQTKPGFRMCLAVPAWKTANGFKHLKVLDSLEEIGYTRQSFVHVENNDLIYYRPDQIVARELAILQRK